MSWWSRSAARSATSSRCRSSRRCASCASSSARRTRSAVHLTLVPYIRAAGEFKTKPTQHSVQKLREIGVQCDVARGALRAAAARGLDQEDGDVLQRRVRRGVPVDRRRTRCTGCRSCCASRGSTRSSPGCSTSGRGRRGCRPGKRSSSGSPSPGARSRSASSASTFQLVESYKSLNEALLHGGIANDCRVEIKHIDSEELEKQGTGSLAGVRRHPGRAGVRRARHRGQDRGGPLRARGQGAVLRDLLRHADGVHRVCAPRVRPRARQLDRDRSDHAAPGGST